MFPALLKRPGSDVFEETNELETFDEEGWEIKNFDQILKRPFSEVLILSFYQTDNFEL